jgi:membrane protein implicated in regulation of membrane protease activity
MPGLDIWLWLAAGILLIGAEAVVSGVVLLWFGLAAVAAGLLFLAVPLDLDAQVLVWGVLSLVTLALGRPVVRRWQRGRNAEANRLNARGRALAGRTVRLDAPLRDGRGRLRVDGGEWSASGPDLAAGTLVVITGIHGNTLTVAAAEPEDVPPAP